MRCRRQCALLTIALAIGSLIVASTLLAQPFSPSTADIQGLGNSTAATNFSTIDAIHVAPNGIHLDVTWRRGQDTDPFGPFFGQNFPRIGLTLFTNGEDSGMGRLLNPPYSGIKWCIMSDRDVFSQPFIQTAPNWTFYEPSNGGNNIPGDMSLQMSVLDFNDARNFAGLQPPNIVHPDANGEIRSNAFGLQIVGPGGLVVGEGVPGHIWITNWVPEPSTAVLLAFGLAGTLGFARRRLS